MAQELHHLELTELAARWSRERDALQGRVALLHTELAVLRATVATNSGRRTDSVSVKPTHSGSMFASQISASCWPSTANLNPLRSFSNSTLTLSPCSSQAGSEMASQYGPGTVPRRKRMADLRKEMGRAQEMHKCFQREGILAQLLTERDEEIRHLKAKLLMHESMRRADALPAHHAHAAIKSGEVEV